MKLGVFDSGLGGLLISKAIHQAMPDLDVLYFGDTLHLPYGNRSASAIEHYTRRAVDAMFRQDCQLIIMACNTASAACLRALQQNYLPRHWPGRNIIGVVVPTLEEAISHGATNIGLIATHFIVNARIYEEELQKINPAVQLQSCATPLLVPLIEQGGEAWIKDVLASYLDGFDLDAMQSLILGCTHYVRLKPYLDDLLPSHIKVLSQDDIIPYKLADYLDRHPEHSSLITRSGRAEFFVSDLTPHYAQAACALYESPLKIEVLDT